MSDTAPFFTSLHDRDPAQLRDDGEALVEVAERGLAHAARDVSMPGIAGSLLQMIEGARLRRDARRSTAVPRRPGRPLERWLLAFPSFGFLLAAPPGAEPRRDAFARRGLAARRCGSFDDTRRAAARRRRRERRLAVGPRRRAAHRAGLAGSSSAGA